MEEYKIVHILPVTACFSEGDEHPSAWSLTKRLPFYPSDCFMSQTKRLLLNPIDCLNTQSIASNRLPFYPSDYFTSQTKRLFLNPINCLMQIMDS